MAKVGQENSYISQVLVTSRKVWDALAELHALQSQATALDYANTLPDGEGSNAGIVRADVIAVVFTTSNAVQTLLDSGHRTNLAKLL